MMISRPDWNTLPKDLRDQARKCLLDTVGVGFGGRNTQLGQIICDHAASQFGGPLPMLWDGRATSVSGYALAGGMCIDALDGHDGFNPAKGHIGCGLIPALLGIAQAHAITDGARFMAALVLGYELGARFAIALHDTAGDYHTSGAWIAPTIAAAGGALLGQSQTIIAHAMGIAEYHGPRSPMMRCIDHPTMLKDGSGWGAMAGVSALELAMAGFTGAPAATLDHPAFADVGTRWRILEQYFKPYPVCRWAQAPVEAVLDLRARHALESRNVARITITSFHEAIRLATNDPQTTEQAQYSTSFPCAIAMVRGRLGPADVLDGFQNDPEISRLSKTLCMQEDPEANAKFPLIRLARAQITLTDGTELQSKWFEPRWDHTAPASEAEIRQKFRDWSAPFCAQSPAVEAAAWAVPENGITPLTDLLSQPINAATTDGK